MRAKAAEDTVRKLEKGRFPKQHPSYTETLEALIHVDELVSKWNDKSSWQKTFGVSMSKGKTQAKKYADKFDDAFKVRCDVFLFSFLFFFHFPLWVLKFFSPMSRYWKQAYRSSPLRSHSRATGEIAQTRLQSLSCKKPQVVGKVRGKKTLTSVSLTLRQSSRSVLLSSNRTLEISKTTWTNLQSWQNVLQSHGRTARNTTSTCTWGNCVTMHGSPSINTTRSRLFR